MFREYSIMNKNLSAYSLTGNYRDVKKYYDDIKKYVVSKTSSHYKDVMVKNKRIVRGINFNLSINRYIYEWLPRIRWKYEKQIEWFWFKFIIETQYTWKHDKIVHDHFAMKEPKTSNG